MHKTFWYICSVLFALFTWETGNRNCAKRKQIHQKQRINLTKPSDGKDVCPSSHNVCPSEWTAPMMFYARHRCHFHVADFVRSFSLCAPLTDRKPDWDKLNALCAIFYPYPIVSFNTNHVLICHFYLQDKYQWIWFNTARRMVGIKSKFHSIVCDFLFIHPRR